MYTPKKVQELLFTRRKDLTFQKRFLIAYIVLFQYSWGTITLLSDKYNVSRQFIYDNTKYFSIFLKPEELKPKKTSKEEAAIFMLTARMESRSSISGTSNLMKHLDLPYNSIGSISEMLTKIGKDIGSNLNIESLDGFTFSICSDEIFAKQKPILITLCPISLLILKIELSDNRKEETWVSHFQGIKKQNLSLSQITNDEGVGMKSAVNQELSDIERQSDTFHAVAHRLGVFVDRFFKIAYKKLDLLQHFETQFDKAKTDNTRIKYMEKAISLYEEADKAVELYENFEIIYHWLLESFQVFNKTGKLKEEKNVRLDFDIALEYLKELNNKEINKEIKSIENCKSDLFTFYKTAKEKVDLLTQTIDIKILNLLCLSWQVNKNRIKTKNKHRKNKLKRREKYILTQVEKLIGSQEYEKNKEIVYLTLNYIIQSSAAVECINSILRYYLNSSNNKVTQEFLNLFMFYHNHRRFKNGERKGKTPMEIATNSVQKMDWKELLLQKVKLN